MAHSDEEGGKAAAAKVPEWTVPDTLPSSMPWLEVQDVTFGIFSKVSFLERRRGPSPFRAPRARLRRRACR